AAGVGNVGDQSVESFHIVLDDGEKAVAAFIASGKRQRLNRRAQRGEGVLELVRYVGGEALYRLDAVIERGGHVAQRPREVTDLVAAVNQIGYLNSGANPTAHQLCAFREPPHRACDGAGKQE